MSEKDPVSEDALVNDHAEVIPWALARTRLAEAAWYWFATIRPDSRPHVRPVLAVWVDGALHTTTSPTTRKGRNLTGDARCAITVASDDLHLVVEGEATRVNDAIRLHRVAETYASKYEWPVEVRHGAFYADGAPTAGPPPYDVYEITPAVAYGFGVDEILGPRSTRWHF